MNEISFIWNFFVVSKVAFRTKENFKRNSALLLRNVLHQSGFNLLQCCFVVCFALISKEALVFIHMCGKRKKKCWMQKVPNSVQGNPHFQGM